MSGGGGGEGLDESSHLILVEAAQIRDICLDFGVKDSRFESQI